MDEPTSLAMPFVKLLVDLGLQGLIIAALAFACYRLYTRNQELNNTLVDITKETVRSAESSTASINRLIDILNAPKARD